MVTTSNALSTFLRFDVPTACGARCSPSLTQEATSATFEPSPNVTATVGG
jgi:hypothetical protein